MYECVTSAVNAQKQGEIERSYRQEIKRGSSSRSKQTSSASHAFNQAQTSQTLFAVGFKVQI
jgi:6-phosphogluconolactonase (cycloisomerase 2 family)